MKQFTKNVAAKLSIPIRSTAAPGTFLTGETVADTAFFNDGGSWTSLAISDTFSEIGSTGVYEIDLTASEFNHDQVIIKTSSTNSQDNIIEINLIPAPANMKEIEEDALSGNSATFNLKQLNVINSSGDAIVASSTGGNGKGINASGDGTGSGFEATGGPTGFGGSFQGGSSGGSGMKIAANADNSNGLSVDGDGSGSAAKFTAGATGVGIDALGGSTSGPGMRVRAQASNSKGLELIGAGNNAGLDILGGATGPGVSIKAGVTSGIGMIIQSQAGNANGVSIFGSGNGAGMNIIGGLTGPGLEIEGGGVTGTGPGILINGGDIGGIGIDVNAGGGNTAALRLKGNADGAGLDAIAGTSGPGAQFTGGTSGLGKAGIILNGGNGNVSGLESIGNGTGHGIHSKSGTGATGDGARFEALSTNGNGLNTIKTGTGKDIDADELLTSQQIRDALKLAATGGGGAAGSIDAAIVDAIAELGVAKPSATPALKDLLMLLYMAFRNESTETAALQQIKNDAGAVITTKAMNDDNITFISGELQ